MPHFADVDPLFDEDVDGLCEKIQEGESLCALDLHRFDSGARAQVPIRLEMQSEQVAAIVDRATQLILGLQMTVLRGETRAIDLDAITEDLQNALANAGLVPQLNLPFLRTSSAGVEVSG